MAPTTTNFLTSYSHFKWWARPDSRQIYGGTGLANHFLRLKLRPYEWLSAGGLFYGRGGYFWFKEISNSPHCRPESVFQVVFLYRDSSFLALKTQGFEFGRLDRNMVSTPGRAYSYLVLTRVILMSQSPNRMFNIISVISLLVSIGAAGVSIARLGPAGPSGPAGATGASGPAGSQGPPGIMSWKTAYFNPTSLPGPAGTVTNLASITFTAPQIGSVLLTATGSCITVQGATQTRIQLSWWPDASDVGALAQSASIAHVAGEPSGSPQNSFAASSWFTAATGSNTFYFNGDNYTGDTGVTCSGNLVLIFTTSNQLQ